MAIGFTEIRKIAPKRSPNTDYLDFLSNINTDIRTGVIRDSEAQSEAVKNERERERITKEKEKKTAGKGEKAAAKENPWGRSGPRRIGRLGAPRRNSTARAQNRMRRPHRRRRRRGRRRRRTDKAK